MAEAPAAAADVASSVGRPPSTLGSALGGVAAAGGAAAAAADENGREAAAAGDSDCVM